MQVDTAKLGAGMADALNKNLAKDGLKSTVTATASDELPAAGRRLQQAGGYGGYGGGKPTCIIVYVVIVPVPAGQAVTSVASVAQLAATSTAKDSKVLVALLTVRVHACWPGGGPAAAAFGGRVRVSRPAYRRPLRALAAPASVVCWSRLARPHSHPHPHPLLPPQVSLPASVLDSLGDLMALIAQIIKLTVDGILGTPSSPAPISPAPTSPIPSSPIPTSPIPSSPAPTSPIPSSPAPTSPIPSSPAPSASPSPGSSPDLSPSPGGYGGSPPLTAASPPPVGDIVASPPINPGGECTNSDTCYLGRNLTVDCKLGGFCLCTDSTCRQVDCSGTISSCSSNGDIACCSV
jgi:hypothetical protein